MILNDQYAFILKARLAKHLPASKISALEMIHWFQRTAEFYRRQKVDIEVAARYEARKFAATVDVPKSKY